MKTLIAITLLMISISTFAESRSEFNRGRHKKSVAFLDIISSTSGDSIFTISTNDSTSAKRNKK